MLTILYQDEHLIAVDKPAGIHTAPLRRGEGGTLVEEVLDRFPGIGSLPGIRDIEPGLLHRLDRDTSGIVIFARNSRAFGNLHDQFRFDLVTKTYLAVCIPLTGGPVHAGDVHLIESRFAPAGPGRRMVRVVPPQENPRFRRGEVTRNTYSTEIAVLDAGVTRILVRASLTRGFRHQVRAHLASLGLPILGDRLYGAESSADDGGRMYLHAASVELAHPADGRRMVIHAGVPEGFTVI